MSDLDKYEEITDLHFEGENPHIAICHKSQGYSANLRTNALLYKSSGDVLNEDVIKSLKGVVDEQVLVKMSFNNKRRLLEDAVDKYLQEQPLNGHEYCYSYVQDFNESMVVFYYHSELYAMDYSESGESITLVGDPVHTKHKDLYVNSETGDELVKAVADLQSNPLEDSSDDGQSAGDADVVPNLKEDKDEETMSKVEKTEMSTDELMKSAAVQELIKQAVAEGVAAKEKELEKKALTDSTTQLVKGFSFVEEDSVELLVKSVLANDEGAEIVKALSAAQEKIEALEDEVIKTKEEFGKQEAVQGDVIDKQNHTPEDREAQLQKAVQAQLAKKSK